MGQIQSLDELLNFLLRRRSLILIITLIGTVIAAIYTKTRVDIYEATAVIQVQGAQISTTGGPSVTSAQLVQSIEQRLTTREALRAMIERHGLYDDLPALTETEKLNLLRRSIAFQSIESAAARNYIHAGEIAAILISARHTDPQHAARIANDLTQAMLDMSASRQIEKAQDSVLFFREEQAELGREIAALEARIVEYRNANAFSLPIIASTQREELVGLDSDLRALEQNLVALEAELALLRQRDTPRATEQRRMEELTQQIAVLGNQKVALNERRAELEAAIAAQPETDRILAGMERELSQLQTSLASTTQRLAEAETNLRLAERQQGERFALLDRATAPEFPTGTSGRKLFAAGVVVSLALALAIAFVLDLLFPVVRSARQMERQLGLRPALIIPEIDFAAPATGGHRHPGRRQGLRLIPRLLARPVTPRGNRRARRTPPATLMLLLALLMPGR